MNIEPYLTVAPRVREAVQNGEPVVALESSIISHGMPYPTNVETALMAEETVREYGAVPRPSAFTRGRSSWGSTGNRSARSPTTRRTPPPGR